MPLLSLQLSLRSSNTEQSSWAVSCEATAEENGLPYQFSAWVEALGTSFGILMQKEQLGATLLRKGLWILSVLKTSWAPL